MTTVTLIFPNVKELCEFEKIVIQSKYETVFHRCMLIGEFPKEMIDMASNKFGASITVRDWFRPFETRILDDTN
jgi:hypothetical protein